MKDRLEKSISKINVDKCLFSLVSNNEGIYAALLSSLDGHSIAKQSIQDFPDAKLAAMTSSCLALGERLAQESRQNHCNFVIIQNATGYLVLKRVGNKLALSTLANKKINMGLLLTATNQAADFLCKTLIT